MTDRYIPIIGLEVHIQLCTNSKMFCGCRADWFGQEPNTLTCPVCLGLPGALPVPNRKAVEWTIMLGLALNCNIARESKFDRKNYFYPDLPKGYQISQYDQPIAVQGWLKSKTNSEFKTQNSKQIRIRRVHLEEDTGKLIHSTVEGERVTLIDFNRSGVPLIEIVTEPDIGSSEAAVVWLKKLRQTIRYLGISDADMEKGSMRIEPNVSILTKANGESGLPNTNDQLPSYKVEIKNINSFKFAKKAIDHEIQRQIKLLSEGKRPLQETRGWDEKRRKTVAQRVKEEAHDYRYFPEPDIPPMKFGRRYLERIKKKIPELPQVKIDRFRQEYGLSPYAAELLAVEKELAEWFEAAVAAYVQTAHPGIKPKTKNQKLKTKASAYAQPIANWIIGEMAALMKKNNVSITEVKIQPAYLAELLYLLDREETSQTAAKQVFEESFRSGVHPIAIIDNKKLRLVKDSAKEKEIVEKVLKENKKAAADYSRGKKEALGFLIGQVLRKTKGRLDAKKAMRLLEKKLKIKNRAPKTQT